MTERVKLPRLDSAHILPGVEVSARGSMPNIPVITDAPARMTMLSPPSPAPIDEAAPMRMTMTRIDG